MVVHQDSRPYRAFNTELSSQDSLISKCRKNMCSSGTDIVSEPFFKNSLDLYSDMNIIHALNCFLILNDMMVFVHNYADIRNFLG